tara:strand:- start:88 stop:315 length:228 start_codon:yes stop_codon:yes gene_type:complete
MAHIYVNIEDYLDSVDSEVLIEELMDRDYEEVSALLKYFKVNGKDESSILDSMKIDLVNEFMNTKTLEELQLFFK